MAAPCSSVGDGSPERQRFAVEAAATVAVASASLVAVGLARETAFYGRLGISVHDLQFPIHHYMVRSVDVLLLPVIYFFMYPALEGCYHLFRRTFLRTTRPADGHGALPGPFTLFSAPAVAGGIALVAAFSGLAGLGDETPKIGLGDLTWLDVGLWFVGIVMVSTVAWAQLRGKESPWQALLGRDRGSQMFLSALAVTGILAAAGALGADQAADRAWGCVSLPTITFDPAQDTLQANHSYWLIARQDDGYLVRDSSLRGNVSEYLIVSADVVVAAHVKWQPAIRNC